MYAPREGERRGRARILYWFRTPPNVRVGRAALDEEAIRTLEASYPGVTFDWTRMLKAAGDKLRHAGRAKVRSARAPGSPAQERREAVEPGRPVSHVEKRLGREGLDRLRALYAELLARLAERVSEPTRLEQLRSKVERLNPDSWVSDEEARRGIAGFEAAYRAVRAELGLRPRRRGRRRRRGGAPGAQRPPGGGGGGGASEGSPAEGSAV